MLTIISKLRKDHPKVLKILIVVVSLVASSIAAQVVMVMLYMLLKVPYLKGLSNAASKGVLFTGIVFAFSVFLVGSKYSYKYLSSYINE